MTACQWEGNNTFKKKNDEKETSRLIKQKVKSPSSLTGWRDVCLQLVRSVSKPVVSLALETAWASQRRHWADLLPSTCQENPTAELPAAEVFRVNWHTAAENMLPNPKKPTPPPQLLGSDKS